MKGIVFREYIDFVADTFGADVADDMIDESDLPSGGAYTSVGKYDWREMTAMVATLAKATDHDADLLVHAFGKHLHNRLASLFPQFYEGCNDSFDLLRRVDALIHVEVKKLYPDAELPSITTTDLPDGALSVIYTSCRPFGTLCLGMIEGAGEHFSDELSIAHVPHQRGLTITVRKLNKAAA